MVTVYKLLLSGAMVLSKFLKSVGRVFTRSREVLGRLLHQDTYTPNLD